MRQQHQCFTATVTLNYKPSSSKDFAGITCYQSEGFNYVFGLTKKDNDYYIVLAKTARRETSIADSKMIKVNTPITLQVKAKGNDYEFSYSLDTQNYNNVGGTVSGDILSTNVAGGFTGSMIGLYATSANDIQP